MRRVSRRFIEDVRVIPEPGVSEYDDAALSPRVRSLPEPDRGSVERDCCSVATALRVDPDRGRVEVRSSARVEPLRGRVDPVAATEMRRDETDVGMRRSAAGVWVAGVRIGAGKRSTASAHLSSEDGAGTELPGRD